MGEKFDPVQPVSLQLGGDAPWYILRAATRQEKRACESLTELKIEHYMPCEIVLRKINRREAHWQRALFPGYLFAQIPDAMFHAVIEADGVHAPVRTYTASGERVPRTIPAGLVAALREAEERGDFDRTQVPPEKPLETGDSVYVTSGPFADKVAVIIELRSNDRIALLLGSLIAEVEASQVERAA